MGVGGMASSSAAYPETTDDESEDLFHYAPTPSQGPIMARTYIHTTYTYSVLMNLLFDISDHRPLVETV